MAKSTSKKPSSPNPWGAPTKERRRQNGGVIRETFADPTRGGALTRRHRAVWECPLDAYRAHRILSRREYRAGLRFQRAYYGVVMCHHEHFDRPVCHEQASMGMSRLERILKAARRIIAPEDLGTVIKICGHATPAQFQRELVSLKRGLNDLSRQWYMAADEVCLPRTKERRIET